MYFRPITQELGYLQELGKSTLQIEGIKERTQFAYAKVKADILTEAHRTNKISMGDLVFLKTFIEDYPDLLEDYDDTFSKYIEKIG